MYFLVVIVTMGNTSTQFCCHQELVVRITQRWCNYLFRSCEDEGDPPKNRWLGLYDLKGGVFISLSNRNYRGSSLYGDSNLRILEK